MINVITYEACLTLTVYPHTESSKAETYNLKQRQVLPKQISSEQEGPGQGQKEKYANANMYIKYDSNHMNLVSPA